MKTVAVFLFGMMISTSASFAAKKSMEERCKEAEPKLRVEAEKCQGIPEPRKREQCFRRLEKGMPAWFKKNCQGIIDAMKAEMKGNDEGHGGPNPPPPGGPNPPPPGGPNPPPPGGPNPPPHGGPNPPPHGGWTEEKCVKAMPKFEAEARKCAKNKTEDAREKCFERMMKGTPPGFMEGCQKFVDELKAKMHGEGGDAHEGH